MRNCSSEEGPNSFGYFLNMESLKGEHVWMNLLSNDVNAYMEQYSQLKLKDPAAVSGCFLVPYQPYCDWFKHFSHMQILREYSPETSLFFTKKGSKMNIPP
jgi:hypothetical protein